MQFARCISKLFSECQPLTHLPKLPLPQRLSPPNEVGFDCVSKAQMALYQILGLPSELQPACRVL